MPTTNIHDLGCGITYNSDTQTAYIDPTVKPTEGFTPITAIESAILDVLRISNLNRQQANLIMAQAAKNVGLHGLADIIHKDQLAQFAEWRTRQHSTSK